MPNASTIWKVSAVRGWTNCLRNLINRVRRSRSGGLKRNRSRNVTAIGSVSTWRHDLSASVGRGLLHELTCRPGAGGASCHRQATPLWHRRNDCASCTSSILVSRLRYSRVRGELLGRCHRAEPCAPPRCSRDQGARASAAGGQGEDGRSTVGRNRHLPYCAIATRQHQEPSRGSAPSMLVPTNTLGSASGSEVGWDIAQPRRNTRRCYCALRLRAKIIARGAAKG